MVIIPMVHLLNNCKSISCLDCDTQKKGPRLQIYMCSLISLTINGLINTKR